MQQMVSSLKALIISTVHEFTSRLRNRGGSLFVSRPGDGFPLELRHLQSSREVTGL
jgi:hypothetical protein